MNGIDNIIAQLESRKAAIERALETLHDFETTGSITPEKSTAKAARGRKRGMTPEGRRRLALAMKRRWAAKRTGTQAKKTTTKKSITKKTGLTAAGRGKLAEAMKRRWAAKRTAAQAKKKAA
ncbi:MAG TPA: hypothetical protein VG273_27795 [Bryobacteraceae bacterium]|jgi:hypothetical protein|nr:hypothetical protein [Bryobacteraceae bacterium]